MSATGAPSTRHGASEQRSAARSLARGSSLNLISGVASTVLNLGLVVLVTRGFPAEQAGVFFAATAVFLVAVRVAELGGTTGIVYFVARARSLERHADAQRAVRLAFLPALAASGLLAAVLVTIGIRAPHLLVAGEPGDLTSYLLLLAACVPVAVISNLAQSATRGYGSMRATALLERLLRPALQVLLTVAAIAVGSSVALGAAWALPFAVTAIIGWRWMHRLRPKAPPEAAGPASPLTGRSYWSFTWARAVTSVVQIILQRADIVLVSALLGPAEAAIYTVATRFLVVGQMISQSIGMAVEPQLAALLARGDLIGTAAVYRTSTSWQILVAWPFYLASAGLAAPLLGLFGEGYEAGSTVAAVLCLTMLVATALGSVSTVLNMAGRTTWTLANAVLSLGTNLVLLVLLLPRIGLIGAAISWAASILVQNLLPLAQLLLQYRLHPFGRVTSVAMLVTGACFGVPLVVMMLTDAPVHVRLLLVGSGVVAYLGACWLMRGPLELNSLAASLRRRPQPSRDAETTPTARPTTA